MKDLREIADPYKGKLAWETFGNSDYLPKLLQKNISIHCMTSLTDVPNNHDGCVEKDSMKVKNLYLM